MQPDKIVAFLRENIEPITDIFGIRAYRCAVKLKDGMDLPCVLMKNSDEYVKFSIHRLNETKKGNLQDSGVFVPSNYHNLFKSLLTGGNRISWHHIATIGKSDYAIPLSRLKEIKAETRTTWTAFTAVMADGREFSFGTPSSTEFFEMPEGYTGDQIAKVLPYRKDDKSLYREKDFFECFVDNL